MSEERALKRKPSPEEREAQRLAAIETYREPTKSPVFGLADGPWHWRNQTYGGDLAWCGIREQFRHRPRKGTVEDVTCPKCLLAIKQDRPRPWSKR